MARCYMSPDNNRSSTAVTPGTDLFGMYVLGTPPCGDETCDLTTGDGPNYRVTSGTLRLAE